VHSSLVRSRVTLAALLTTSLASVMLSNKALAHGIWFAERSGQIALVYGHGAEDLDMIKRADKVGALLAFDANGNTLPTAWTRSDYLLLADTRAKPQVLATSLDNGYWCKLQNGQWAAGGRDEAAQAKACGRYIKYTVRLQGALSSPMQAIEGQRLQITPLSASLPTRVGQPIRLRVTFDGRPAVGALVTQDYAGHPDAKPIRVGSTGVISMATRNQGLNVISAAFEALSEDRAKADTLSLFASLSFALGHAPE
jgi:nickel transport protein